MTENRLRRLCTKLAGLHGAYFGLRVLEQESADRVLDLHWAVRRQMANCEIATSDDIEAVLEAADRARELDPHFLRLGRGSYVDLTTRALDSIRRRRSEQERAADELLANVIRQARL